ncbi:MAG: hypothetical protein ACOYBS_10770 [Flavobacterium sp.]
MKFFNFLFYKSYKVALLLGNEGFYPEINAWFLAILFPWLNILSVLIFLKNELIISNEVFRIILISTSVLWIVSYIYCVQNKNYLKILSDQEKSISKMKYSNTLYILYVLITSIIYFGFLSN